jgi:hypothetical protein
MRGQGAFPFTYNALKTLELNTMLVVHVIKIGWRNTVGRASYKLGRSVAHLIAENSSSANYQTVKHIETQLMNVEYKIKDKNKITKEIEKSANDLATNYFNLLKTAPPPFTLTEDSDGTTNSSMNLNKKSIIDGYVYILTTLYRLFGVPINFFQSGSEENWDKQWDNPGVVHVYQFKENKLNQSGGKTKKNKKTKNKLKTKKPKKTKKLQKKK